MGKSDRKKPRRIESSSQVEEIEEREPNPPPMLLSSDDDAYEDLNLKIVEKSNLRASNNVNNNGNPSSSSLSSEVIIVDVKKIKKTEITGKENDVEEGKRKEDCGKLKETDGFLEIDPEEKSNNIVLRKLLRGPRYFDPPHSSWGNCYNCGEAGHMTANCTAAKSKRPCFVCGSLEHNAKQCKQGKGCFICKKGGHCAKNCPEKSKDGFQRDKLCLKCGDSGHDMFACRTVYSLDDLKELQCYICKCFGHLCCFNYAAGARELSCYRCGQLGHTGLECASACAHAETANAASHNSCYKGGEEGHKARKCASSAKKRKRKTDFSRPKQSHLNDNRDHVGVRSAPHDLGKARKRNKTQHGQPTPSPSQSNRRGGWTEAPGGYYRGPFNANNWGSPSTPVSYRSNNCLHGNHSASGYGLGFQYGASGSFAGASGYGQYGASGSNAGASGYGPGFQYGASGSNGNTSGHGSGFQYKALGSNGYQNRFSASRFGNSGNYGRREYGWDY